MTCYHTHINYFYIPLTQKAFDKKWNSLNKERLKKHLSDEKQRILREFNTLPNINILFTGVSRFNINIFFENKDTHKKYIATKRGIYESK